MWQNFVWKMFKNSEILNQYYYSLKYNKDELNNGN